MRMADLPNLSKTDDLSQQQKRFRTLMTLACILFAFIFLALSTWVVRGVEEDQLLRSARTYAKAIDSFRDFYTERIVNPLISHSSVEISEHYRERPGSIPIPATMTLDLTAFMSDRDGNIQTRLISDFPFPQRSKREILAFDKDALKQMRQTTVNEVYRFEPNSEGKMLMFATPVYMQATCIACHNSHIDSPKRDWKVGDVRGVQVVTLPASKNVWVQSTRFFYLLSFVFIAFITALLALFVMDRRVRKTVGLLYDRNQKLEEASKELKQQQNALDQHAIVSMTNAAGNIIYTNQHFRDISGYQNDYLIGKNHRIINSGHHPTKMFEQLWHTITAGQVWHGEIKNLSKTGDFYWVKATIMPLYDANGEIDRYISIRTNITQQKQLEQDLKHSNDELYALTLTLDEARKTAVTASEAKSAFLANMSHEIRTPMTGIIGMTELALDTQLTATQRGYLGVVKSSADALLSILNDILDFSKIDAGKLEITPVETDIKSLILQCLKPAALLARKKGIALVVEILPGVPDRCQVDPVRVRQILVNICDNAIKFTAQGYVNVTVAWQAEVEDGDGQLLLTILDQGIGIPLAQQAHIFEAFSQADDSTTRRFGGTGLGLAITARLVELMHGKMGIESEVDKGSCFWVQLPCSQAVFQTNQSKTLSQQILLLSHRREQLNTLSMMVEQLGYSTQTFDSAEVLLRTAKEHIVKKATECPPLFFIQHHLNAETNGIEVIKELIQCGFSVDQCVLISDASGDLLNSDLQLLGLTRVITYPPTPVEIAEMLHPKGDSDISAVIVNEEPVLNILLVEDNMVNQRLISTLLTKRQHTVTLAENGQEAVDLCKREFFDLILMDMQMPVMGGVEATEQIRIQERLLGRVPVTIFAMTANVMAADKEACLTAGMNGHLGKPIKLTDLDSVLNAVKGSVLE